MMPETLHPAPTSETVSSEPVEKKCAYCGAPSAFSPCKSCSAEMNMIRQGRSR